MFTTKELRVFEMFNGDRVFDIPEYQRKFIWDTTQWNQLISDIRYCIKNNDDVFLGTVVLDEANKGEDIFQIIDGRQRLTTFMCIFIASIAYLKSEYCNDETIENKHAIISNLFGFLIKDNGAEKKRIRMLNESSIFQNLCDEISKDGTDACSSFSSRSFANILIDNSDDRCSKAIKHFFDFFKKRDNNGKPIIEFSCFYEKMRKIRMVTVEADNTSDAYTVFEVLNARGVQLTQLELLKAYLLKQTKSDEHFTSVKTKIETIEAAIPDDEQDNFLLHSVKCLYNYSQISTKNIYKTITEKHSSFSVQERVTFVDNLTSLSKIYKDYQKINLNASDDRENLISFCSLKKIRIYRPLMLALDYKKEIIGNYYALLFKYLFHFAILNVINKTYSNKFDKDLSKVANKIYSANRQSVIIFHFFNFFKSKLILCSRELVEASIKTYRYSNKVNAFDNQSKALIHILKYDYDSLQPELEINYNQTNIEHILNDSETEEYKLTFGNLLIVNERINSEELKSKPYPEKRIIYLNSDINYVRQFAEENDSFDAAKCAERTRTIETSLLNRFVISKDEIENILKQTIRVLKMNALVNNETRFNACFTKNLSETLRIINSSTDLEDEKEELKAIASSEIIFGKELDEELSTLIL